MRQFRLVFHLDRASNDSNNYFPAYYINLGGKGGEFASAVVPGQSSLA